jgi:DNA modification methylase
MGSGTTAIAAQNLARNFIGFEICKEYFDKAYVRMDRNPDRDIGVKSPEFTAKGVPGNQLGLLDI